MGKVVFTSPRTLRGLGLQKLLFPFIFRGNVPLISFQVRDLQKKMQQVENELDNTLEKLGGTNVKLDEKVKLVS